MLDYERLCAKRDGLLHRLEAARAALGDALVELAPLRDANERLTKKTVELEQALSWVQEVEREQRERLANADARLAAVHRTLAEIRSEAHEGVHRDKNLVMDLVDRLHRAWRTQADQG